MSLRSEFDETIMKILPTARGITEREDGGLGKLLQVSHAMDVLSLVAALPEDQLTPMEEFLAITIRRPLELIINLCDDPINLLKIMQCINNEETKHWNFTIEYTEQGTLDD